jgi:hypothetical protein
MNCKWTTYICRIAKIKCMPPRDRLKNCMLKVCSMREIFCLVIALQSIFLPDRTKKLRGMSPQARTIPTEQPLLVGEVSASFSGQRVSRGQRNKSPTVVNFGFLDWSCYFLEIAPQLSSRGWVDPVPDLLIFRKSGSAGNRIRTSGSVARNSDH